MCASIPNNRVLIKNSLFCALLILFTAVLIAGCGGGNGSGNTTPYQPPPSTSFSGMVTMNGTALAGATVIAFNTNTNSTFGTTTTDANGHYSFSAMGATCTNSCKMNFQFWPVKTGYVFYPQMASNLNGDRSAYLWDPSPSNWYVTSGAAVTRAGYNGQFVAASGGAGLIFTVLNFNSVPNNSVAGGNFIAFDGSNPLVHLAASGQVTSYVAGDDASHHAGVAWPSTRFTDNSNGTITDALTGLIWLKDAGCLTPGLWAAAINEVNMLASGSCGLSDGSSAGQWRLPNMWELESMIDESATHPVITAGNLFTNVTGTYWTSTSYYGGITGSPSAWAIRMSDGRYINDGITNVKTSSALAVWAVKGSGGGTVKLQATGFYVPYTSGDDGTVQAGVPLTSPRMRDNGNGTVTDTVTGLIWLKQADCINQVWDAAIAAVNTLASGQCGLTDGSSAGQWRMPNRKEMESLADHAQNNQADFFDTAWTSGSSTLNSMSAVFTHFIQFQYYWTSSTNASDTSESWTVFSCDFGVYNIAKSSTGYTLAVR